MYTICNTLYTLYGQVGVDLTHRVYPISPLSKELKLYREKIAIFYEYVAGSSWRIGETLDNEFRKLHWMS
jgi:hypothetical protein